MSSETADTGKDLNVSGTADIEDEDDSSDAELDAALFQDPEGYIQPEKLPTYASYTLGTGQKLSLRLVGSHPLWGHLLWNAGQVVARYLEDHAARLCVGKAVLELGAGAGLPGLTAASLGASKVVITDYPDIDLVENIKYNVEHSGVVSRPDGQIVVEVGRLSLSSHHPFDLFARATFGGTPSGAMENAFDTLILADVLFNHSEHEKLVKSVCMALKRNESATALVFFTPYRPWLLEKDMDFFRIARLSGLEVEQVLEHVMDRVMFENDRGDEQLRRTVFGYELRCSRP